VKIDLVGRRREPEAGHAHLFSRVGFAAQDRGVPVMTEQAPTRSPPPRVSSRAPAGFATDERTSQALPGAAAIVADIGACAFSRTIEREAARLLGAERALLYLLEDDGRSLRAHGDGGNAVDGPPSGQALLWTALASGRLVSVSQACAEPLFASATDRSTAAARRSVLAAPVMSKSTPLGVLEVAGKIGGSFGEDDERRLTSLCNIVAAAWDKVKTEKRLRAMISRYMDPRLAGQLLETGLDVLGGRSIRATVLFCDLRNSTGLAEDLGTQALVSLLNEFFTLMETCLRAEGAMVDKFIGDAVLAAFGIPDATGDDEDRAVRAALAMTKALRQWNDARAASALPELRMGIGINTDVVVAGNIGSPKRMDYTVIGAGVNVAARLETACKREGAAILVSEQTIRRLRGRYRIRPADAIEIPGRSLPVAIYEVLDHAPDVA
jgi:class 3 adenylate cyclase